jgi:3-methylfumaryl-CoA hydratase
MTESVEHTELLLPGPAAALGGLLDVPVPDLDGGAPLPLLWHWVYLLERPAQRDLGADGHPLRGGPTPPGPGRRRMWAGGEVRLLGPLRCGEPATRRSRLLEVRDRPGRTGPLTFVTVGHEIVQDGRVVVDERQDIVYRTTAVAPAPSVASAAGPQPQDGEWALQVTPTLLFRFSALTYNAHRIHYDRDYCRDVEGYPGLVTPGPLQALAMVEVARAQGLTPLPRLRLVYRLVAPLFDHQGLIARATVDAGTGQVRMGVRDDTGRQTAVGTLTGAVPD